jgi:hypothetical protein
MIGLIAARDNDRNRLRVAREGRNPMNRKRLVAAVIVAALMPLACSDMTRRDDAALSAADRPKAAPSTGPAAPPAPSPAPPDVGLPMPPKDQLEKIGESTVVFDVEDPAGKPPALPDQAWIDLFLRRMHEAFNNRDARFILSRFAAGVRIELTLGARSMKMTPQEWFVSAMTSLQAVEKYRWTVEDRSFTIDGKKVVLRVKIVEQYDRNGETVRGRTAQTMDLEWQPATGDFLIHSMVADSSGISDPAPPADSDRG